MGDLGGLLGVVCPRRGAAMASGAALWLLGGCAAVSPEGRMGEALPEVPPAWAETGAGRAGVDHGWIARFGDPRLRAMVAEAMVRNPDIGAALARLEMAAARVRIAGSDALPQASGNFNARRQKQNFIGFPFGGDEGDAGGGGAMGGAGGPGEGAVLSNRSNTFGVSLDVTWELDVWGRIRAGQSAAVAEAEAVAAELEAARGSLAAQVAKAYFAFVEAGLQMRVAEETVGTFRTTEEAIRGRFELGQEGAGSLGADLRLALTDVASAEAAVAERRQQRAEAARQLEVLLGHYPAGDEAARAQLPPLPSPPPAGLPSGLLLRRPDLLAAERRFAKQGARLEEARRARFPQIALTGSGGTSTDELENLLDSDFGVWSIAANAVQPIVAGGRIRAEIDLRNAEEREALALLQGTVLQAFSEVETALANERHLAQREAALGRAADLAAAADAGARDDYAGGSGDLLTVLRAQERALQTRASYLTVRRLRLDNRVNLHLALGGDFEARGK